MYCTTHEQHDCMTCRSLTAEKELAEAKAELARLRAQKPSVFAYKIFSSSSGFVYTEDESEAARGGSDSGGYKKLYAQPVLDPTHCSPRMRG